MIEKLQINHLRTLDALYKFENLSTAAEYLDISQQAVSLQLKKIRTILGDELFARAGHGVVATPYAKLIEPHIRQILTHLNDIPLPGSVTPANAERTLVISATDYTQKIIVGALINDLKISAPGVKIIVINIESAHLIQKMKQGDINLTLTSSTYVPEGLLSEALFAERYVCVTANKDIHFDDLLPLERLVEYDFVVTSPGIASFKGSADSWFEQQKLRRKVQVSVPSFFMAQEYLKQSGMVGFLPSRLMPCDGLFEMPLKKYPPGYEVVAAYHPSARNDAFMIWLLERIRQKFTIR